MSRVGNYKKKWQRKFIKEVFDSSYEKKKNFSKIVLKNPNLVNRKNEYLPKNLFKYFSPTSENILDLQNQRLWLSNPKSFNDPFDSNIGYDREKFEKRTFVKYISELGCVDEEDQSNGFTLKEKKRIQDSYTEDNLNWMTDKESYLNAKYKILESKSDDLTKEVWRFLNEKTKALDKKIRKLKEINIRVACFSGLDRYDEFYKQIAMWSHYADNHKGFCVEYDLSSLRLDSQIELPSYDFYYDNKDEYLDERNILIIKAGLFPIEYTSKRINIPVTKLNKIKLKPSGELEYNTNLEEIIYKTFVVKSSNWSYEKEWRIIIDSQICEYYDNKIPFPFIKTIYIGCKASKELINTLVDISKNIGAEVELLKMDGKKFALDYNGLWQYEHYVKEKRRKDPYSL